MIEMSIDLFFLLYLGTGGFLIFGLWFYYDWRDERICRTQGIQVIYHCIKCGHIYVELKESEECDCPQCGFTNGRLRF